MEITALKINVYFVSVNSPIGQALSGHSVGDMVETKTPGGIRKLMIKEIY
jgi:transcription elongation GreA/GreB family factor